MISKSIQIDKIQTQVTSLLWCFGVARDITSHETTIGDFKASPLPPPPPEGDTVVFEAHRSSVGSEVCEVCLVGRTERGRQRRGVEAECVWERKNTKQKVRRDN